MDNIYQEKKYDQNAIITLEGSPAKAIFYIIKTGELESKMVVNGKALIYNYKEGDTFGLISCVTGFNYIERVTALTDCTLILVNKNDIIPFLLNKKDIFLKVVSIYSKRLKDLDNLLIQYSSNSIYMENPGILIDIANYYENQNIKKYAYYALTKYLEITENETKKKELQKRLESITEKYEVPKASNSKIKIKADDIIFLEQEKGNDLYFLEKGKVKICHIYNKKEFIIAIINENEFFGEMAILNKDERNACAIALEDSQLLVLNKDNFLYNLNDPILKKIFLSLATRIWFTYRKILNLSYKDPATRLYDYLELLIASNEGRSDKNAYHFDFSIDHLKMMTSTTDVSDEAIKPFLSDSNLQFNYSKISIADISIFHSKASLFINREKV